jgi:hypothetical protein
VTKTEQKRASLIEKMTTDRLSVQQAAEALGIPRSTAFRIMQGVVVEVPVQPQPPAIIENQFEGTDTPKPKPEPQRTPGVDPYAELFKDME